MSAVHQIAIAIKDLRVRDEQMAAARGHLVELLDVVDEADREWREERPEDRTISSDDFRKHARLALLALGYREGADA